MPERRVTIGSASGLHARPAAVFTQAAAACAAQVRISKGGRVVDAASILGVMSLVARQGDEVLLSVEGPDADRVLDELGELLASDMDAG
ncbi:HPr family phosphocarrier protein [Streptomyces ipomoeae]|uniref:HPr family phosphocarrier protein n=1 Tax=Streptomyces ipomoeae TaxID=103232 RepID=UPI0011462455|nr:HPr family phosphocarrier protein [Streptomyces ipomoeae]MDX2933445.1 HPr family phosphocarrier protein [Streptomyces ipomoeae]TQE20286.1 HPr family phosphocarrier protein [Streptomyces ipomoeae]